MRKIALFVEDQGHRRIIGALVERLAKDHDIGVQLNWNSTRHGHGKVASELKDFLQGVNQHSDELPDLIIVAADANCKGLNVRERELRDIGEPNAPDRMIYAIPDPHVERWLLLDGAAFRAALGKGCDAPDQKCDRDRYKMLLSDAVTASGKSARIGGLEHAEKIIQRIDIDRASHTDKSLKRFVDALQSTFRSWQQP